MHSFENFLINVQINVSFKIEYVEYVNKDIQQNWILTQKTMALSYWFL